MDGPLKIKESSSTILFAINTNEQTALAGKAFLDLLRKYLHVKSLKLSAHDGAVYEAKLTGYKANAVLLYPRKSTMLTKLQSP